MSNSINNLGIQISENHNLTDDNRANGHLILNKENSSAGVDYQDFVKINQS